MGPISKSSTFAVPSNYLLPCHAVRLRWKRFACVEQSDVFEKGNLRFSAKIIE